ncbi:unnamed protein product, partial [Mesorhabditis spiculigera]
MDGSFVVTSASLQSPPQKQPNALTMFKLVLLIALFGASVAQFTSPSYLSGQWGVGGLQGQYSLGSTDPGYGIGSQYGMSPLNGYGSGYGIQYPGQYGQYPYGPLSSALGLGGYGSMYGLGGLQGYGSQYGMMPGYGTQYGLGGMTPMCLTADFLMRPSAAQVLDECARLNYDFQPVPEHRRHNTILLLPIGLDGTTREREVFPSLNGLTARITDWTSQQFQPNHDFKMEAKKDQLAIDGCPLFCLWLELISREIHFDDIIIRDYNFNPENRYENARELSNERRGLSAIFRAQFDVLGTEDREEIAKKLETILQDAYSPRTDLPDSPFKDSPKAKAVAWIAENFPDLKGAFFKLFELDTQIHLSCFNFALQMMADGETSRLSNSEAVHYYTMARRNLEETANIFTCRTFLATFTISDSRSEWLQFRKMIFRKDLREFRVYNKKSVFTKQQKSPLDTEALRRGLVDKIRDVEKFQKEEAEQLARRSSGGSPRLSEDILPDPSYCFLFDNPPRFPCKCETECESFPVGYPGQVQHKIFACTTEEQMHFMKSFSFYERAFRYLEYWPEVPSNPIYRILLDELIEQSDEMWENLATYYIAVDGEGRLKTHVLDRNSKKNFLGDRAIPALRDHVGGNWKKVGSMEAGTESIGAIRVDFCELAPILRKTAKVFHRLEAGQSFPSRVRDWYYKIKETSHQEVRRDKLADQIDAFWTKRGLVDDEYTSPYVSSQFGLNGLQGQYSIGGGYPGYGIGSQYGMSPLSGYGSQYGIYPYGQMSPAYGLQGYGSPYALGGIRGYPSQYGQLSGYGSQYGLGGLQGYGGQYGSQYYGSNGLTGGYGITGLQGGVSRSCSLLSGCGIGERCNTCGVRCEKQCYGPQTSCPLVNLCSNSLSATASGVCECLPGFARNTNGQCVADISCQAEFLLYYIGFTQCFRWYGILSLVCYMAFLHLWSIYDISRFRKLPEKTFTISIFGILIFSAAVCVPLVTPFAGFIYNAAYHYWSFDPLKPGFDLYSWWNWISQGICLFSIISADLYVIYFLQKHRQRRNISKSVSSNTATIVFENISAASSTKHIATLHLVVSQVI